MYSNNVSERTHIVGSNSRCTRAYEGSPRCFFVHVARSGTSMASVDSGVETGNDSNDSSIVQHENQRATTIASSVATVANVNVATTDQIDEVKPVAVSDTDFVITYRCLDDWEEDLYPFMNACNRRRLLDDTEHGWCKNVFRTYKGTVPLCRIRYGKSYRRRVRRENHGCFSMRERSYFDVLERDKHWIELRRPYNEQKMRLAAGTNDIQTVEDLLNRNISPNNYDTEGRTPLHHAACRGYTDIVRLLLERGADPNQCDRIGNTPLHLAAIISNISIVTLLLASGTNVSLKDQHGFNPLHLAQAKLKMLQSYKQDENMNIKEEMHSIVEMLMTYLVKQSNMNEQIETLNNFCSRLSLSSTSDEVQDDVKDLLANLETLDLTS